MSTMAEHGRTSAGVAAGGASAEALAGVAAVILAILGLAKLWPPLMVAIGVLVLGAAFIFHGAAMSARGRGLATYEGAAEAVSGMDAEFLGGLTGLVLGVLALIRIVPEILMPVAIIVFGAVLVLSGSGNVRTISDATAAVGPHALIGIGAVVLGILALVGFAPLTLTLVGVLVLGAGILLAGSSLAARLTGALTR